MYKEIPVLKYTKIFIIFMILAVILKVVFTRKFLTNAKDYVFYNGKIYLNKKDCDLANNKKCVLKGFWIMDNYSLLSNLIKILQKEKECGDINRIS